MKLESRARSSSRRNGVTIDAGGGAFSAKGSQAKVEGSGTAEISSSGQTTVRGLDGHRSTEMRRSGRCRSQHGSGTRRGTRA